MYEPKMELFENDKTEVLLLFVWNFNITLKEPGMLTDNVKIYCSQKARRRQVNLPLGEREETPGKNIQESSKSIAAYIWRQRELQ